MDKNNLTEIKRRVSDFLCNMYNFRLSNTLVLESSKKMLKSLFYTEHKISDKINVLDDDGYKFIFYGDLDRLIKYGDENYNKLVNIFESIGKENKFWADDLVSFMELNKNNIFPDDLIDHENHKKNKRPRYYIKKIKDYADKPDKALEQKKEIEEWLDNIKKDKFGHEDHIINNYKSDLAIAYFLFEIIKYRHEKNYKITSRDVLKLSAFINDDNLRVKFKLIASGFLFLKPDDYDKLIKDDINYSCIDARTPEQKQNDIKILFGEDSQEIKFQAIKMAYSDRSRIFSELLKNYIKCFENESGEKIKYYLDNRSQVYDLSKFSDEALDLYKKSLIDIKFIFDFGLDTGKTDSSGKFDEKREAFIKFLDLIPEIGKLNFNLDILSDDQKYLVIISLVHDEFKKIKTNGGGRFVFDKFAFENLDLEKYKLSAETKKMAATYIRGYAEIYFASNNKDYVKNLIAKRNNLKNRIKELEQELLKINSELDGYKKESDSVVNKNLIPKAKIKTEIASTQESFNGSDEQKKIKSDLDNITNREKTLKDRVDNLKKEQFKLKNIGIALACTVVFSVFSLVCFYFYKRKEDEINKIGSELKKANDKYEKLKQKSIAQSAKSAADKILKNFEATFKKSDAIKAKKNKLEDKKKQIIKQINEIKFDLDAVNQMIDEYNIFFDRLSGYIDNDYKKENKIIPKKQKELTKSIKLIECRNKKADENQIGEGINEYNG